MEQRLEEALRSAQEARRAREEAQGLDSLGLLDTESLLALPRAPVARPAAASAFVTGRPASVVVENAHFEELPADSRPFSCLQVDMSSRILLARLQPQPSSSSSLALPHSRAHRVRTEPPAHRYGGCAVLGAPPAPSCCMVSERPRIIAAGGATLGGGAAGDLRLISRDLRLASARSSQP